MTELIHMKGDIFTTKARAIGHGVNIDGLMGTGIALQFKRRFPEMHTRYVELCREKKLAPGSVYVWQQSSHPDLFVYNISSQDRPGRNARYSFLTSGVVRAVEHAQERGLDRIALPRIGSGVGGLDQDRVERILRTIADSYPVDIELWTLPENV